MKTCPKCGEEKPLVGFYLRRNGRPSDAKCKACISVERKVQYHADPEKFRALKRAYNLKFGDRIRRYRQANQERIAATQRAYHLANPEKVARWNANAREKQKADPLFWRKQRLRQEFGMTVEDYEAELAAQGGTCAICGGPPVGKDPVYHVDHNHETGARRGLLCGNCNLMLGLMRDDPRLLERAIAYLHRYEVLAATS